MVLMVLKRYLYRLDVGMHSLEAQTHDSSTPRFLSADAHLGHFTAACGYNEQG